MFGVIIGPKLFAMNRLKPVNELGGATLFRSAAEAEEGFYTAFAETDMGLMMAVWDDADDIECIHPLGPRLIGRGAIGSSWRRMFGEGPTLTFRCTEVHRFTQAELAVHVVHERIQVGDDESLVIATNAYRLTSAGWRMILHHASPLPRPAMKREAVSIH
jgi:hypothetical protein